MRGRTRRSSGIAESPVGRFRASGLLHMIDGPRSWRRWHWTHYFTTTIFRVIEATPASIR
jgi:hypothetical protein